MKYSGKFSTHNNNNNIHYENEKILKKNYCTRNVP